MHVQCLRISEDSDCEVCSLSLQKKFEKDPVDNTLLGSSSKSEDMDVVDDGDGDNSVSTESSQPNSSPAYGEMLGVMAQATKRLDLVWPHEKQKLACGKLDECFLTSYDLPFPRSLPFLSGLHTELVRLWDRPYSARLHLSACRLC
ncbi:Glutamate--tRNA ligase [Labeo rohita]|uniref:Glutamate--tRNA ligase n=1 Tax=Labeo rohita TaxID=84645 RepID=A0ABQ8M2W4_LABRO|nr:Glutamate--tRNA ligase [Labeo rohita]